ncbi:MAG TPA: HD domain-containing protein [Patescibacteria group bacterium]|nr:HD domain-containing protein [Patescibacteria group bacterium]
MHGDVLPPRYMHALQVTARLFATHQRAVTGDPFVTHLYGVSYVVSQLTWDEDVRIAALLHDVLEDVPSETYDAAKLEADFGPRVRMLVETVTHDIKKYGKEDALKRYLQQLETGPAEASLISGADMLYNTRDMLDAYAKDADATAKIFGGAGAKRRDWFWHGRYDIIINKLGPSHALAQALTAMLPAFDDMNHKIM